MNNSTLNFLAGLIHKAPQELDAILWVIAYGYVEQGKLQKLTLKQLEELAQTASRANEYKLGLDDIKHQLNDLLGDSVPSSASERCDQTMDMFCESRSPNTTNNTGESTC